MNPVARLLSFAAGAALLAAAHALLRYGQVGELWQDGTREIHRQLGRGELVHYQLLLVLGLPAAVLLSHSLSEGMLQRLRRGVAYGGLWLPSLLAVAGAACLSSFVTHGAWFTDDEQAYIFQMLSYRDFKLSVPLVQPEPVFYHPFVVVAQTKDGAQHWAGVYSVLQPVLMAISGAFFSPLLSQWLCVGGIVYQTGRFVVGLTQRPALGLFAAWLCATSPMLLGLGSTYHTAILACLLSVSTARAGLRLMEHTTFKQGALTGLLGGLTFLTRGAEGVVMLAAAGAFLLWLVAKQPKQRFGALLGFALSAVAVLGVYFALNWGATGDPFVSTYGMWEQNNGRILGFGDHMMWGAPHSPLMGLQQTFAALARLNVWSFGWPVGLLFAWSSLAFQPVAVPVRMLFALSLAHLSFYFFLSFGSVHDFGSAYHVWHVPWLAAMAAYAFSDVSARMPSAARLACGLTVTGLAVFWPVQIERWQATAHGVLAPVKAAEHAAKGRKAIVLWDNVRPGGLNSWVFSAPANYPGLPMWWAKEGAGVAADLKKSYPDRVLLRLTWSGQEPRVTELE